MKKAKLWIDGKEFSVELSEEQIQDLTKKKTGYERVEKGERYYIVVNSGGLSSYKEDNSMADNRVYEEANYYSDKSIAENIARADTLHRKLRRFAVEHRKNKVDWNDKATPKYYIAYGHRDDIFDIGCIYSCHDHGAIYFDSRKTAQLAIDTFKDELIWYFTEYKDSL